MHILTIQQHMYALRLIPFRSVLFFYVLFCSVYSLDLHTEVCVFLDVITKTHTNNLRVVFDQLNLLQTILM